ncbi:MAG TPA: ATP-binding protein [Bryobacteraceae bacterium]|nr:ATP-binding protein [Bryobacteraceae bacterium]
MLLCIFLAIFGPDRSEYTVTTLTGIGVMQVIQPKIPYFRTGFGTAMSFLISLGLWYILMGWTDGIESSYYWILVLPVIAVATSAGFVGTALATVAACAAYVSFIVFLRPGQFIPPDEWKVVILRTAIFPVVGYFAQELTEASRSAVRRAEAAAEQLSDANSRLQEAQAAMRRSDRLAALGQLSAGLAHELRNPLGTVKASAEMLAKSVESTNEVAREMAGFISSEVDRTNALVTRFLDFARPLALRLENTDLAQVIDEAVTEVGQHVPPFNVSIYKNYSPDIPPFLCDHQLMERVIYNLLLNAAQASPPGGSITVKTRQLDGTVEVAVIDRGSGIEPKHLENIFNPFFTTKSSGVGLGLAIVSKIVDEHQGKITVESETGAGTVFRVFLPLRETKGKDGA